MFELLLTYNNDMKHSAKQMTPEEARKLSNELTELNWASAAKKNGLYPELDKGDEVKIFGKRKPNEKARVGNWSKNICTAERVEEQVGQKCFLLVVWIERI